MVFVGHHFEQTALKRPSPYLLMSQDALPSFKKALAQQVLLIWFEACSPSKNISFVPRFSVNPDLN